LSPLALAGRAQAKQKKALSPACLGWALAQAKQKKGNCPLPLNNKQKKAFVLVLTNNRPLQKRGKTPLNFYTNQSTNLCCNHIYIYTNIMYLIKSSTQIN
jgi:hypothetical protein